jgi:hypothetical protein
MLLVISRFEILPGRRVALEDWLQRVEECNHALMAPLLRVDGEPDLLFTLARYRDKAHRDDWVADSRRKRLVEDLPAIARVTKQVYEAELIEDELIGFGPGAASAAANESR